MSRPTKYDIKEILPIVETSLAKKESKVEIAKKLNISRNTLHYWINKYPELKKLFG